MLLKEIYENNVRLDEWGGKLLKTTNADEDFLLIAGCYKNEWCQYFQQNNLFFKRNIQVRFRLLLLALISVIGFSAHGLMHRENYSN